MNCSMFLLEDYSGYPERIISAFRSVGQASNATEDTPSEITADMT